MLSAENFTQRIKGTKLVNHKMKWWIATVIGVKTSDYFEIKAAVEHLSIKEGFFLFFVILH